MLIAETPNGDRVKAYNLSKKRIINKGDFLCPVCNKSVMARRGTENIWHFAHYPNQKYDHADSPFKKYWKNESERHKEMKKELCNWFKKLSGVQSVDTEVLYTDNDDAVILDVEVTFENESVLAVEAQHTDIGLNEINKRSEKITQFVNGVIWVKDVSHIPPNNNDWCINEDNDIYIQGSPTIQRPHRYPLRVKNETPRREKIDRLTLNGNGLQASVQVTHHSHGVIEPRRCTYSELFADTTILGVRT